MIGTINTKPFRIDIPPYAKTVAKRTLKAQMPLFIYIYAVLLLTGLFLLPELIFGIVGGVLVSIPLLPLLVRSKVNVLLNRSGNSRSLLMERVVSFNEEAAFQRTAGGIESKVPWDQFLKVEVEGEYIMFYLTEQYFWTVPLSAFAYQRDIHSLKEFLVSKRLLAEKHAALMAKQLPTRNTAT